MSAAECVRFEKTLAYHTAPSLLGIKCANLICVRKSEFSVQEQLERFRKKARSSNLNIRILRIYPDRVLLLVYHEKMLAKQIMTHHALLADYGYTENTTLECALEKLAERMQCCAEFPHEIGIFLGYPVEDVLGFIQNKGENYLLCGYWKVYSHAEQAKRTFANYDKCRNFLCHKLNQGCDIYQALRIS